VHHTEEVVAVVAMKVVEIDLPVVLDVQEMEPEAQGL
jgi:hypothetical protein